MSDDIVPYRINADRGQLDDLRTRLERTRWPEPETVTDWSQGVPLAYLRDLCGYWAAGYDWSDREARLNSLPQYRTVIDGLGIHFVHVRAANPDALPLVVTHGWPGSFAQFVDVVGPLTDPERFGGDASDAFHLVLPSLPGYGFSDKPKNPGWGVERTAKGALHEKRFRLLEAAVDETADARIRSSRLPGWAVRVDPREVLVLDRHRRRPGKSPRGGPDPRRRHALLVTGYGGVLGANVLGIVQPAAPRAGECTDGRFCLPERDLPGIAALGRTTVQRHSLLGRTGCGRPLRRLRTADAVRRGSSAVLPDRSLKPVGPPLTENGT